MTKAHSILLVVALSGLGGCAAQSKAPPTADKSTAAPAGPTAAEDEAAMQQAVEQLERAKADAVVPRAHNDCQAVCKLSDLICEAADKICTIAGRHASEPAYVQRCTGADRDCKRSQEECERCTGERL